MEAATTSETREAAPIALNSSTRKQRVHPLKVPNSRIAARRASHRSSTAPVHPLKSSKLSDRLVARALARQTRPRPMAQAEASCSVRIDRTLRSTVEAGVCLVDRDFGLMPQRNHTAGASMWLRNDLCAGLFRCCGAHVLCTMPAAARRPTICRCKQTDYADLRPFDTRASSCELVVRHCASPLACLPSEPIKRVRTGRGAESARVLQTRRDVWLHRPCSAKEQLRSTTERRRVDCPRLRWHLSRCHWPGATLRSKQNDVGAKKTIFHLSPWRIPLHGTAGGVHQLHIRCAILSGVRNH